MLWLPKRSPITQPPAGSILDPSDPINDGCVLCLPFNEGCGDKTYDVSGYGNHGTLTSMDPYTDWVAGNDGFALDFDGGDDSVALATNVALSSTNDLTLSVWFKTTSTTADQQIIEHQIASNDRAFISLNRTDGHVHCSVYNGTFYNASGPYVAGEWNHVAFSWMTGSLSTYGYVNGKLVSGSTVGFSSAGTGFKIGRRPATGTNYFTGMCANVRCFSRALSTPEIERLYYEPWAGFEEQRIVISASAAPAPTTTINVRQRSPLTQPVAGTSLNDAPINEGLVLCLPFNEGCGDKVYDASRYNAVGTFKSIVGWSTGPEGTCLSIPASASAPSVSIPNNPDQFNFDNGAAIAVLFQYKGITHNFIDKGYNTGSTNRLLLRFQSNLLRLVASSNDRIAPGTLVSGKWYFFVCNIYADHTTEVYRDGAIVLARGGTGSSTVTNTDAFVVGDRADQTGAADGPSDIHSVRMYNRTLNVDEIYTLMQNIWAGFDEQTLLVGSAAVPEGEMASNLFLPTQSAQGKVLVSGSGSQNLFLPVSSAQGSVPVQGSIAQNLYLPVNTSQGSAPVQGGIVSNLFLPSQSLVGKAPINGDISQEMYLPISTAMDEAYIKKCQQRCGLGLYTHLG